MPMYIVHVHTFKRRLFGKHEKYNQNNVCGVTVSYVRIILNVPSMYIRSLPVSLLLTPLNFMAVLYLQVIIENKHSGCTEGIKYLQ